MLRPSRLVAALIVAFAIVLTTALPAAAHVTVSDPEQTTAGSFQRIRFSVPNERLNANTNKLKIVMPVEASQVLPRVLAKRTPGWNVSVQRQAGADEIGEGVLSVTWTAFTHLNSIPPHLFEEFVITVGPVPNTDRIYFDAIQTYTNGEVVSWNERPTASNPNPAHPAPVLEIVPAASAENASNTGTIALASATTAETGNGSFGAATLIALVALLGTGGLLWQRRRVLHTDQAS